MNVKEKCTCYFAETQNLFSEISIYIYTFRCADDSTVVFNDPDYMGRRSGLPEKSDHEWETPWYR